MAKTRVYVLIRSGSVLNMLFELWLRSTTRPLCNDGIQVQDSLT